MSDTAHVALPRARTSCFSRKQSMLDADKSNHCLWLFFVYAYLLSHLSRSKARLIKAAIRDSQHAIRIYGSYMQKFVQARSIVQLY